jgi:hypothetical protein
MKSFVTIAEESFMKGYDSLKTVELLIPRDHRMEPHL